MKKTALHLSIVLLTILCFSESCYYTSPPFVTPTKEVPKTATNADAQYINVSGMKYLIVSSPQGITLANVTKDSLEVMVRRRNEKYLELLNRSFPKPKFTKQ
ncbi:MAG: hypothetical protein LCH91_05305 [Bacteroidetes bacterium]|nr:hypothetical protein [Bacteroidota bacterium]